MPTPIAARPISLRGLNLKHLKIEQIVRMIDYKIHSIFFKQIAALKECVDKYGTLMNNIHKGYNEVGRDQIQTQVLKNPFETQLRQCKQQFPEFDAVTQLEQVAEFRKSLEEIQGNLTSIKGDSQRVRTLGAYIGALLKQEAKVEGSMDKLRFFPSFSDYEKKIVAAPATAPTPPERLTPNPQNISVTSIHSASESGKEVSSEQPVES